jgi:hypothetical protein
VLYRHRRSIYVGRNHFWHLLDQYGPSDFFMLNLLTDDIYSNQADQKCLQDYQRGQTLGNRMRPTAANNMAQSSHQSFFEIVNREKHLIMTIRGVMATKTIPGMTTSHFRLVTGTPTQRSWLILDISWRCEQEYRQVEFEVEPTRLFVEIANSIQTSQEIVLKSIISTDTP